MRRRQSITTSLAAGDPGKDLFAYLFLLIMVFSFMLLMSVEQAEEGAQKAPDQKKSTKSTYSEIAKENIAVLENRDSKIFLRFGKDLYDPQKDIEKLEQDKRIVVKKEGKKNMKFLYINKSNHESISLSQYLETFKSFSEHNISIAFAVNVL